MFSALVALAITLHPGLDEQITDLSAQLRTDPDSVQLLTLRGAVYFQHREFALALGDFEHALALAPGDAALIRHRASTLHNSGQTPAALAALNEHITRSPSDADALLLRGRIHRSLNCLSDAAADFESLLSLLESLRPEIFLELADIYTEMNDAHARAVTLRRAVDRLGPLPHILEPLARAQIAIHDFAAADATIAQLADAIPSSFIPALLRAEKMEAMGDCDAAAAAFSALIQSIDRSHPRLHGSELAAQTRAQAAQARLRLAPAPESGQ